MNPSLKDTGKKELEDAVISKVSVADIEHVGLDRILEVIQDALKEQGDNAKEMFVSLKRVPFICLKIESIEEHMTISDTKFNHLIEMIEKNRDKSESLHENFVTKDQMASFTAVYVSEFSTLKKIIFGCTSAIMLAVLANFLSRIL